MQTRTQREDHIRRMVKAHQESLWLWLRTLGAGSALAEDLAQDAFLILLAKPWRDWNNAQIAGFLRVTGRNLLMARNAKKRRRVELLAKHAEELWERLMPEEDTAQLRGKLLGCVDALPERERSIVREHYLSEVAIADLAESQETTAQALYGLLHRARKHLRECMQGKMEQ